MQNKDELKSWRQATVALVLLAAFVFITQRFIGLFPDITFEIFLFYIPAFSIVVLFLYLRRKLR